MTNAAQDPDAIAARKRKRERAIKIIRELQKKTEDNGCTEEEAMLAAEKIGQLQDEYDLDMGEIGLKEEAKDCTADHVFAADNYASSIVVGIGRFCGLIVYQDLNVRGHAAAYRLFGMPHDLEVGKYLYELCMMAMEDDFGRWTMTNKFSLEARSSFRQGFAHRVNERLRVMKKEKEARMYRSAGTSLVVVKDALVKSEFDQLGIKTRKAAGQVVRDASAYGAGQAAGGRVNLNNPLGGGERRSELRQD